MSDQLPFHCFFSDALRSRTINSSGVPTISLRSFGTWITRMAVTAYPLPLIKPSSVASPDDSVSHCKINNKVYRRPTFELFYVSYGIYITIIAL